MSTTSTSFTSNQASTEKLLRYVIVTLQQAKHICILTGAGISAESGIPTFRDKQTGLWENYRAEDLATLAAFQKDPKLVWSWYQWRRHQVKDKQPNPAHHALASWQNNAKQLGQKVTIITQNVDDLHEQAGSTVSHLHGHLWKNKCSQCHASYLNTIDTADPSLVHCSLCDGYIRPDIVWFGEGLPQQAWQNAEQAAIDCDIFMSIGTSSLVYPADGLASIAKSGQNNETIVIEVNPNSTDNPVVDIALSAKAGEILPRIVAGVMTTSS